MAARASSLSRRRSADPGREPPAALSPASSDALVLSALDTAGLHSGPRRSASDSDAAEVAARLHGAGGVEMLAALQRNASAPGEAGGFGSPDDGPEQNSLVGIKRSSSGVLSPSKDSQKVPLKCAPLSPCAR